MFKGWNKISIIVLLSICCTSLLFSRDKRSLDNSAKNNSTTFSTDIDSIYYPPINWPVPYAELQTGKIIASFDNFGHFGAGYFYSDDIGRPTLPDDASSFETPAFSDIEYLFGGAIWIGAIVNGDTLVSTSADGWQSGYDEFVGNRNEPSIEKINILSDYSLRYDFSDSDTYTPHPDIISGKPFTPLNIKIIDKSYVWWNDPLDNAVIYDYTITNVGDQQLEQVYIGLFFDGDVGSPNGPQGSGYYNDDVAGSLRDSGIAYIIDADGDPYNGSFNSISPRKAFALKLLASSFIPIDTSFNWWVSGQGTYDYGPRLKGTPDDPFRDFGTGVLGTPTGDANKYYMLSHREWDFDQCMIKNIALNDTSWITPSPYLTETWSIGTDTRFLYSIGPIDLAPGQSERIIFSTFTADSIHIYPANLSNLPNDPFLYEDNLNLENLLSVGSAIRTAVDSILNPLIQPTGLQIYENNKISFDPYVFPEVTGYNVYATPVDASLFPLPGAIPPWYRPESPIFIGSNIDEIPLNATNGLTAVQVSYTSNLGESELSTPDYINIPTPVAPLLNPYSFSSSPGSVSFKWIIPDTAIEPAYFKIYKYDSLKAFKNDYVKPSYSECCSNSYTTDSIQVDDTWWFYQSAVAEPYAIVPGNEREYTDYDFQNNKFYYVISVDEFGFESDYDETQVFLTPEVSKDLLIILKSDVATMSTTDTTIRNFYNKLLGGSQIQYDIYSVYDSVVADVCTSFEVCPTWQEMSQYKFVLVDESEYMPQFWMDKIPKFVMNGGKFINFGSLTQIMNSPPALYPAWYSSVYLNSYYFGVDSVFAYGHLYDLYPPGVTDEFGFNIAVSEDTLFPSLECDTLRYPLDNLWNVFPTVPINEPVQVTGFMASDSAVVTHRYHSLYPEISLMEGLAVGLKNIWFNGFVNFEVYTYGFHLYYMKYEDSRNLLSAILGEEIVVPPGCCVDRRGNVNFDVDDHVDIQDLTSLVDFIFLSGATPACIDEANVDGDLENIIDISDLVYLVDYVFTTNLPTMIF